VELEHRLDHKLRALYAIFLPAMSVSYRFQFRGIERTPEGFEPNSR